jgi:putative FmdB family regulatory protein
MAVYTFRCRKCNEEVVVEHVIADPHPTTHEDCGGELARVFDSQKDVVYKALGFTRTNKRFEPSPKDM